MGDIELTKNLSYRFSMKASALTKIIFILGLGCGVLALFPGLAIGSDFTGIYSCSSGINNEKPVTYVFNRKLMVRDNNEIMPFEFVGEKSSGELFYFGKGKHEDTDRLLSKHGALNEGTLRFWVQEKLRGATSTTFGASPDSLDLSNEYHEELALKAALSCKITGVAAVSSGSLFGMLEYKPQCVVHKGRTVCKGDPAYDSAPQIKALNQAEKSTFLDDLANCDMMEGFAKEKGIENLVEYFLSKNLERALKENPEILRDTFATVDTKNFVVYESYPLTAGKATDVYNCSIIKAPVPNIKKPPNPVIKEKVRL